MKELLQLLAQQLVKNPNEVDVRKTSGGIVSILELRVAKEDLGRVTGLTRAPEIVRADSPDV
jgi:predicted RNA-binding protein YlqC (UPF0109 family)